MGLITHRRKATAKKRVAERDIQCLDWSALIGSRLFRGLYIPYGYTTVEYVRSIKRDHRDPDDDMMDPLYVLLRLLPVPNPMYILEIMAATHFISGNQIKSTIYHRYASAFFLFLDHARRTLM